MWRFWSKCADMINGELSGLIMSIRDIRLNDSLSDDALIALSRSYVSMQNLVVANGLDSEFGSRKEFEKALDILFRICHRRCQPNQPFARRSRLLPLLHGLVTLPMRVAELRRVQECNGQMWQLVDEWMQNPETHAERMSVYGVLRCIAALWGGMADEERTAGNAEVLWFRQRIGDWASLLSGEGRWDGVESGEALCRIEVMSRNSNLFLDGSNDELIELARSSYCESVLGALGRRSGMPPRGCGMRLFMLYEVMMWGVGIPDLDSVDEIARTAAALAEQCPCGSDEWLLCRSTVLDRLCMLVVAEDDEPGAAGRPDGFLADIA